jgi:hypothetical protein
VCSRLRRRVVVGGFMSSAPNRQGGIVTRARHLVKILPTTFVRLVVRTSFITNDLSL